VKSVHIMCLEGRSYPISLDETRQICQGQRHNRLRQFLCLSVEDFFCFARSNPLFPCVEPLRPDKQCLALLNWHMTTSLFNVQISKGMSDPVVDNLISRHTVDMALFLSMVSTDDFLFCPYTFELTIKFQTYPRSMACSMVSEVT
jgi:hypothetical protein